MKQFPTAVRRRVIVAGLSLLATCGWAQQFPSRPIRLIVPAAPGGPTDTIARVLGKAIGEQTGATVFVEHKAGAAGSLGVLAVVNAPADGYTLVIAGPDPITVLPVMKKAPPYRPEKDLTPITTVANTNFVFAVGSQSRARTIGEFVALAKANPMSYSSTGNGGAIHLVMEMFRQRVGIDLLHVPYGGTGPALLAAATGQTDFAASSPAGVKPLVDSGKLRVLAITSKARSKVLPAVPTMTESGFKDFVLPIWFGIFASPGLQPAVADRLNEMFQGAIRSADFARLSEMLGFEIDPVSREQFARVLKAETAAWRTVIQDARIPLEE